LRPKHLFAASVPPKILLTQWFYWLLSRRDGSQVSYFTWAVVGECTN